MECLRDGRTETFWQSDGVAPHLLNIQFPRKMVLKAGSRAQQLPMGSLAENVLASARPAGPQEISLYVDFNLDESYTPEKISVRLGNGCNDLKEFKSVDLDKPSGWINIQLETGEGDQAEPVKVRAALVACAGGTGHRQRAMPPAAAGLHGPGGAPSEPPERQGQPSSSGQDPRPARGRPGPAKRSGGALWLPNDRGPGLHSHKIAPVFHTGFSDPALYLTSD